MNEYFTANEEINYTLYCFQCFLSDLNNGELIEAEKIHHTMLSLIGIVIVEDES